MSEPAADIIDLYEHYAGRYDALRGRSLFEKLWLDRFLSLAPPDSEILDIGCGMGEPITAYIVGSGYRVVGIDSSASMIELCRRRMPTQRFEMGDMRDLSLGQRFAGLIAWDSFFHLAFNDQRAMFSIFAAHAARGAALMFTSGPAHGEAIGSFEDAPLYHASLAPEEYRTLLAGNGFEVLDYVPEDPACGGHTVWLARYSGS